MATADSVNILRVDDPKPTCDWLPRRYRIQVMDGPDEGNESDWTAVDALPPVWFVPTEDNSFAHCYTLKTIHDDFARYPRALVVTGLYCWDGKEE